jgi:hypothetical protein
LKCGGSWKRFQRSTAPRDKVEFSQPLRLSPLRGVAPSVYRRPKLRRLVLVRTCRGICVFSEPRTLTSIQSTLPKGELSVKTPAHLLRSLHCLFCALAGALNRASARPDKRWMPNTTRSNLRTTRSESSAFTMARTKVGHARTPCGSGRLISRMRNEVHDTRRQSLRFLQGKAGQTPG